MKARAAESRPIDIIATDTTADETSHAKAVREMFSGIARRYDFLNHFLSLNIDRYWRRRVCSQLADVLSNRSALLLDVACGTGDLAFKMKQVGKARVVGADFCEPMLKIAKKKARDSSLDVPFAEADAMRLPFEDQSVDAVTISFGLRNLPNIENGLKELFRLLKPGGELVILEFTTPVVPGFRPLFNFYFRRVLPYLGGKLSGSPPAYKYLPVSVAHFPDQPALAELMRTVGYRNVKYENLTGGVAAIHTGKRP